MTVRLQYLSNMGYVGIILALHLVIRSKNVRLYKFSAF